VEHPKESKAPTSARVSHALVRGNSVATRRATTSDREVGEGGEEMRRWPNKLERNIFSLDQIGSRNPKAIRKKGKGDD
jgi:hypothetical protein